MQKIVNAAPTAGEGDRVQGMISALVTAGIDAGYLVNSRLAKVHWQAAGRPLPAPAVSVAGESALVGRPRRDPVRRRRQQARAKPWPPGCTGTATS